MQLTMTSVRIVELSSVRGLLIRFKVDLDHCKLTDHSFQVYFK